LLVLLVSREHDDTAPFVRQTLLAKEVVDYIGDTRNNIILWAGTVQDAEAYQVAAALNCSKFPFAALIAHTPHVSSTAMSVVARVVGPSPPAAFVATLRDAAAQHSATLEQARAARASREAERSLREQQDSAYQRSLAQDRERARRRREEEASRARAEQEARQRLEAKQQREQRRTQWRQWRAQQLSAEPPADAKTAIRVSIRMLSGERVVRRFASGADIDELYAYVECCDLLRASVEDSGTKAVARPEGYEHSYGFRLVSPMPRTVYDPHTGVCIGQRIMGNSNLVVEPLDEDDDDNEASNAD
jgi:FAS-associated factor 2